MDGRQNELDTQDSSLKSDSTLMSAELKLLIMSLRADLGTIAQHGKKSIEAYIKKDEEQTLATSSSLAQVQSFTGEGISVDSLSQFPVLLSGLIGSMSDEQVVEMISGGWFSKGKTTTHTSPLLTMLQRLQAKGKYSVKNIKRLVGQYQQAKVEALAAKEAAERTAKAESVRQTAQLASRLEALERAQKRTEERLGDTEARIEAGQKALGGLIAWIGTQDDDRTMGEARKELLGLIGGANRAITDGLQNAPKGHGSMYGSSATVRVFNEDSGKAKIRSVTSALGFACIDAIVADEKSSRPIGTAGLGSRSPRPNADNKERCAVMDLLVKLLGNTEADHTSTIIKEGTTGEHFPADLRDKLNAIIRSKTEDLSDVVTWGDHNQYAGNPKTRLQCIMTEVNPNRAIYLSPELFSDLFKEWEGAPETTTANAGKGA